MARPTKLNPERSEKVLMALRKGSPLEAAAALAGIRRATIYDWVRRGIRAQDRETGTLIPIPEEEQPFAEFADGVTEALAEWETRQIEGIEAHGRKEWTAHAWLLERRWPAKYGRRDRIDHSHDLNVVLPAVPPPDQEPLERIQGSVEEHPALPSGRKETRG